MFSEKSTTLDTKVPKEPKIKIVKEPKAALLVPKIHKEPKVKEPKIPKIPKVKEPKIHKEPKVKVVKVVKVVKEPKAALLVPKIPKEPKAKTQKQKPKNKQMTPEQMHIFMEKRTKCIERYRNNIMKTLKTIKRKTKNNPPKIVINLE